SHEVADRGPGRPGEHLHLGAAARAGAGDDVRPAVAVDVAGRDEDAAGEGRGVGVEAPHDVRRVARGERLDVRPAAGAGPGDDVVHAVAVDVGRGDAHAAGEARGVGQEVVGERAVAVVDLDLRHPARAGADREALRGAVDRYGRRRGVGALVI